MFAVEAQAQKNITLQYLLNSYFTNEVQLSLDEKKTAYEQAIPIIEKLVKYINQQDKRFGTDYIKVGSSFQGLKTGQPNEYDVNIPLTGFQNHQWTTYRPRKYAVTPVQGGASSSTPSYGASASVFGPERPPFYQLEQHVKRVEDIQLSCTIQDQPCPPDGYDFLSLNSDLPLWKNTSDLTFEGDVIPILVKKHLKKLLIEGVRQLGLRGVVDLSIMRRSHGPAITIIIQPEHLGFKINIDFAAVLQKYLPFSEYDAPWPHVDESGRETSWPSAAKKRAISELGLSAVARTDIYWLLSPALAERELMKGIDQPEECRRKSHRIMKKLNEDLWSLESKKAISSYALKNILFWECERYPNNSDWKNDQLETRIISMTKNLHERAKEGKLEKFFVPSFNIFETKSDQEELNLRVTADRIGKFLNDPFAAMKKLMEKRLA